MKCLSHLDISSCLDKCQECTVSPPHHFCETDKRQKKNDTNYQPGWIYGA